MSHVRFSGACAALVAAVLLCATVSVHGQQASILTGRTAAENAALVKAGVQVNIEPGTPFTGDFAMGPGRQTFSMKPGDERTVEVQITARTEGYHEYVFETEDFAAGTADGQATALFGALAGPYPAREWLTPAVPSIRLTHGERAFIPVTIRVPLDADPGDHYAALLLKRTLAPGETTDRGFDVVSRVGNLFLVTVDGPAVRDVSLISLTVRKALNWFLPVRLDLTARNNGTVYAAPSGTVKIRNILGFIVDEVPVEDWVVLRNSTRVLNMEWKPSFALGRYTAETDLTAFDAPLAPVQTAFWVFPALPLLLVLFAIFVVSFLVQYFFSRFEIQRKRK